MKYKFFTKKQQLFIKILDKLLQITFSMFNLPLILVILKQYMAFNFSSVFHLWFCFSSMWFITQLKYGLSYHSFEKLLGIERFLKTKFLCLNLVIPLSFKVQKVDETNLHLWRKTLFAPWAALTVYDSKNSNDHALLVSVSALQVFHNYTC